MIKRLIFAIVGIMIVCAAYGRGGVRPTDTGHFNDGMLINVNGVYKYISAGALWDVVNMLQSREDDPCEEIEQRRMSQIVEAMKDVAFIHPRNRQAIHGAHFFATGALNALNARNDDDVRRMRDYLNVARGFDPRLNTSWTNPSTSVVYRFNVNLNPRSGTVAIFNGSSLFVNRGNSTIAHWPSFAGMAECQDGRYQQLAWRGPLPEGVYAILQNEVFAYEDHRGTGRDAWGNYRIWLHPSLQTNMGARADRLGRSQFFIHGRQAERSLRQGARQTAGCIGMDCYVMDEFVDWFRRFRSDLILIVDYSIPDPALPITHQFQTIGR